MLIISLLERHYNSTSVRLLNDKPSFVYNSSNPLKRVQNIVNENEK